MIFENDLVLRQRTRLVRTKNVDAAEILDGVEIFYHRLLFRHRHGAFCEAGGDDDGQHFGRQSHGDGYSEEKRVQPIAFRESVYEEHDGHHHRHKAEQDMRNGADSLFERSRLALSLGKFFRRSAQNGIIPDGDGNAGRAARHHRASRECERGNFRKGKEFCVVGVSERGAFFHGFALSRQCRLVDEEIFCGKEPKVCGDDVARREEHNISHDDFLDGQLDRALVFADDFRLCLNEFGKPRRGAARTGFLYEA